MIARALLEVKRLWNLLKNMRRFGLTRAWRLYLLAHKYYPYGTVVRIEKEEEADR